MMNIILERYLLIMVIAFTTSFISIFFGGYYLIKAVNFVKDSQNYKMIQHYFITSFIYILIIPITIISGSSVLVSLFATSANPIQTSHPIIMNVTEVIYERDPLQIYLFLIGLAAIIYWLVRYIKLHKKLQLR